MISQILEPETFEDRNSELDYDVLIIGAGLSGIYSVHRMTELGLRTRILEAGSDVGGTWFWNRYPGARFDSESYTYNLFFSDEVNKDWKWSEHFAPQAETLRYIEFLCDRLDLKKHMQFNTKVKSAHWQAEHYWLLTDDAERQYTAKYLITAIGILNEYTLPNIPGVYDFEGEVFHTARWPKESVNLTNKRVGILGTGATGIQVIQEIAKDVGHLTVLQRTPNWSAPLRNGKITEEEQKFIDDNHVDIKHRCDESVANFMHMPSARNVLDEAPEEREEFWEKLYATRGFEKWLSNYKDIHTSKEANALVSEFFAKKIRERVHDPQTAETLIPKCHGFGTKRLPLESGYFEVFNQENVRLKDVKADPIVKVTKTGIKTEDEEMEFDVLIYATGFDGVTGSFTAIDFQGVDGSKLSEKWAEGPRTYLGVYVKDFPNMMILLGPHQMVGNIPRSIEYTGEWIARFMKHVRDNNIDYVECTNKSVESWTQHVFDCAQGLLANEVDSWMTGVNKNLGHKQKRIIARYNGPAPGYRKKTKEVEENGYEGLLMLS